MTFEAINWNKVEDDKDLEVWDRLTGNFWRSWLLMPMRRMTSSLAPGRLMLSGRLWKLRTRIGSSNG